MVFPSQKVSHLTKLPQEFHEQQWLSDSVELNLTGLSYEINKGNSSSTIVVVFYRNLSSYLPERFVARKGVTDVEYQLMSSLIAVRMRDNNQFLGQHTQVKVKLTSFNHTVEKHGGWNISCAMVDFSQGNIQFTTSGCHILRTTGNITLCDCQQLGTYALLLTHYTIPEEIHVQTGFDVVAGAGCAICAFFLLITLFLLLSFWEKIKGAISALKLQVCIALLGAYGTILCGLDNSLSEDFYPYIVTLIQFFLLASFSLQLCIGLSVYNECIELKDIHYSSIKVAAIGWAVPVIVLGATLAAQSLYGFSLDGWGFTVGSNFFYAYTSSILILTMFQVLLFIIVKTEIRNHRKVADFLHKKESRVYINRAKLLHRSLLLTTTLLLVSVASILYVNFDHHVFEYFFASSSAVLGLVVFLSYTVCSERQLTFCCSHEIKEGSHESQGNISRSRSNSFKSFLKPEIIDDSYSDKFQLDIEKRTDRIKRMYSQIEKASLASDLRKDITMRLVEQDSSNSKIHSSSFPPITERHKHDETSHYMKRDSFYSSNSENDDYSSMNWRCGNHSQLLFGDSYIKDEKEDQSVLQKPLLQCETGEHFQQYSENCRKNRCVIDEDQMCVNGTSLELTSESEDSVMPSITTFQGTVKADVITEKPTQYSVSPAFSTMTNAESLELSDVQNNSEDADDKYSFKSSCFLHHTDSLETIVYCDQTANTIDHSSLSVDTISSLPNTCTNNGLVTLHSGKSASWNMTSV